MDRLDGSARLMIVSDLDMTMVDREDPENISLQRFNALWEAYYRQDSLLVYSTGRSPMIYNKLREERPLLTPDIAVMSVGTEIMYGAGGEAMVRDNGWDHRLNQNWDRGIVLEETAKFTQLTPQPETEQRPHKVSFFVEKLKALEVLKALPVLLEKRGLDVKVIYSNGMALDVLPKGAGKGEALAYLLRKFDADGKKPINTLVCGDSGNDAELFSVPEVYGVMVSNAQEELLQWHAENAKNNPHIIHATERCAAGIIQAIGKFSLGPNVSPRDIRDFQKCKVDIFSPGHEVVKFYLFYERWRRAEVERSEESMQNMNLVKFLSCLCLCANITILIDSLGNTYFIIDGSFVFFSLKFPLGTFFHPMGIEQTFSQCIDALAKLYGDKQGTRYRVWVNRVSFEQIGSDIWLSKFCKWESSGEKQLGCLNTVLLSSKAKAPDGLIWMHMHQTWLDSPNPEDETTWFF